MTWWHALIDAGAVPGSYVPPPSAGALARDEAGGPAAAALGEDAELQAPAVPSGPGFIPPAVSFLNGMARWSVVAYDGVVQIVNAYVAAAVCRRDERGVLHATHERSRAFAGAPIERVSPALRPVLQQAAPAIEPVGGARGGQPPRYPGKVEPTVRSPCAPP